MDHRAILDNGPMPDPSLPEGLQQRPWSGVPNSTEPATSGDIKFPGEDGGKSLAEMAQRDLVATLQLLTERAQYITGATGAAIALRDGSIMTCRASAGTCAPEVGAQLQIDSGLSGESVRTQQTLRCDDAATDPRVNRESCEALGIASVVVMPLVQGSEVIGVFELFSDKAHAFQTRDIAALERMGAMVFTALENALAALKDAASTAIAVPQPLPTASESTPPAPPEGTTISAALAHNVAVTAESPATPTPETSPVGSPETPFPDGPVKIPGSSGFTFYTDQSEPGALSAPPPTPESSQALGQEDEVADILEEPAGPVSLPGTGTLVLPSPPQAAPAQAEADILESGATAPKEVQLTTQSGELEPGLDASGSPSPEVGAPPANRPRSEVAGLRRCERCGFPISEGRQLCLDCERKGASAATGSTAKSPSANAPVDLSQEQSVPPPAAAINAPAPKFLRDELSESSWLANHKLLVIAGVIVVVATVAFWLLR